MPRPRMSLATLLLAVAAAGAYCWMLREVVGLAEREGGPIGAGRMGLIALAGLVAFAAPIELAGRLRHDRLPKRLVHFTVAACLFAVLNAWVVIAVVLLAAAATVIYIPAAIALVQQGPEGRAELRRAIKGLGLLLVELIGLDLAYLLILEMTYDSP